MECYACSNQATRQCRRCARVYCELHGGDLCAECLSPASSLPSFNLYRGSLLALLVGSAIALWLIVRPPGSQSSRPVILAQGTPTVAAATATTGTPTLTVTPGATGTVVAVTTPPLGPTATPGVRTYIVQSGDTLYGIAGRFAPPGTTQYDYEQQIASASGLSSVNDPISPGQQLVLP